MGEAALTSHMDGKKHKQLMDTRKKSILLFSWTAPKTQECATSGTSGTVALSSEGSTATIDSGTSGPTPIPSVRSSKPVTMDSYVTKSDTLSAEIYWTLHVVTSHSSYNSSEGSGALFQKMFTDSVIAKEFTCGQSKFTDTHKNIRT